MNPKPIFKSDMGKAKIMALLDLELAKWPVEYQARMLRTSYGDTFVIESGDSGAKPLILIHGANGNSTNWISDVENYSKTHHVFAIDVVGEPGKSDSIRLDLKGPAYADWFGEVLDSLNLTSSSIVGISQGGFIALKFAVHRPDRVQKLILLCPAGVVPDTVIKLMIKLLPPFLLGIKKGVRRATKTMYGKFSIPEGIEKTMSVVMKNYTARSTINPVFSDVELGELTMPTLLIGGSEDVFRSFKKIENRLSNFLPQLSAFQIDGGGHALVGTSGIILQFLAKD